MLKSACAQRVEEVFNARCRSHKATEDLSNMMKMNEVGNELGHGTTVCGDPKTWFPMRVTCRWGD